MKLKLLVCAATLVLSALPALACDRLDVVVTGNLSSGLLMQTSDGKARESVTLPIPLDRIGISDTTVTAQFVRTEDEQWRVGLSHEFLGHKEPLVVSPIAMIDFEAGNQTVPQYASLFPFTSGQGAGIPVTITFEGLKVRPGPSDIRVATVDVTETECRPEVMATIKSEPDEVRDELNPMTAAELDAAVNGKQ